jgi:hypothetical protein
MGQKGGVRLSACAASLLAALALSGCGDDDQMDLVWDGPPPAGPSGAVATDGFATYQSEVDGRWERSPVTAAAEFLRLDERRAARTTVDSEASSGEGTGPVTVVVVLDGLTDDSIRSERWSLGFEQSDGAYALTAALREQRCQPGRGHQDFTADACV